MRAGFMLAPVWGVPAQISAAKTPVTAAGVHWAVRGEETVMKTVEQQHAGESRLDR